MATAAADTITLDKRTLRENATQLIRRLITSGELAPGMHLVETRLSGTLGVSRGTIREALRPLQTEGLVVTDGRGHLYVRQTSHAEIREVFDVRGALETLAAARLASRADRASIAATLRDALAPLQNQDLTFEEQIGVDLHFHETLCALTGNQTLLTSWRQLIGQIEMMIIAAGPDRARDRMRHPEHIGIADAIAAGDPAVAHDTVAQHLTEFALKYLGDEPAPPV